MTGEQLAKSADIQVVSESALGNDIGEMLLRKEQEQRAAFARQEVSFPLQVRAAAWAFQNSMEMKKTGARIVNSTVPEVKLRNADVRELMGSQTAEK